MHRQHRRVSAWLISASKTEQVSSLVGEISATAASQRNDIEQVGRAVESLHQGTQQNAALVEQA